MLLNYVACINLLINGCCSSLFE